MSMRAPQSYHRISVIGGGAWGSALAVHFHRRQQLHCLYTQHESTIKSIKNKGVSPNLGNIAIDKDLPCTRDPVQAAKADIWLVTSKLTQLEYTLQHFAPYVTRQHIVLCTKGVISGDGLRTDLPHHIAQRLLPSTSVALLSGPSFAHDVARGMPVAVALAARQAEYLTPLAEALWHPLLRLYPTRDIDGVGWCGALKNVCAIANGLARGLGVGSSGEAALITRGLAELSTLMRAVGAAESTCSSLAGLGDLLLTCSHETSRNMRLGMLIAQGQSVQEALNTLTTSAEGYYSCRLIPTLRQNHHIEMPIMTTVHQVLYNHLSPTLAMQKLLERDPCFFLGTD